MSQENVDVIHRLYAVMRSRDPRAIVDSVDPEVEWVPDQRVGEPAVRGRAEVFEFFSTGPRSSARSRSSSSD
jgi:hypothetical protein